MMEHTARVDEAGTPHAVEGNGEAEPQANQPVQIAIPNWLPMFERLLVWRIPERETATPGGKIVQAEAYREKPTEGVVLAVGEETKHGWRRGDQILFGQFAGVELPELQYGPGLLIMREAEVLAVRHRPDEGTSTEGP